MTTRDKIEQIEYARDDARKAYGDDYYATVAPCEHGQIPGFIAECNRQIAALERGEDVTL